VEREGRQGLIEFFARARLEDLPAGGLIGGAAGAATGDTATGDAPGTSDRPVSDMSTDTTYATGGQGRDTVAPEAVGGAGGAVTGAVVGGLVGVYGGLVLFERLGSTVH